MELIKPVYDCGHIMVRKNSKYYLVQIEFVGSKIVKTLTINEKPDYFFYQNHEINLIDQNRIVTLSNSILSYVMNFDKTLIIDELNIPYFQIQNEWFEITKDGYQEKNPIGKKWIFENVYDIETISLKEFEGHHFNNKSIITDNKIKMTKTMYDNFSHGCFTYGDEYLIHKNKTYFIKCDCAVPVDNYFAIIHENKVLIIKSWCDSTWATEEIKIN